MKVRTSLALKFTVAAAAVFLLLVAAAALMAERSRSESFCRRLRAEAVTKANLFLSGKADPQTMQRIYRNNGNFIDEVEVALYRPDFTLVYHDAAEKDIIKEDAEMVARASAEGGLYFTVGEYQCLAVPYVFEGEDYVVTAAAYDGYGLEAVRNLRLVLAVLLGAALVLLLGAGYLMARSALRPVRDVALQAEGMSAGNISRRLPQAGNDEMGELCRAFNGMLDRLEDSFEAQKMFVSNVSHELRTPLAAMTAGLEIALMKERTPDQYRKAIEEALSDSERVSSLLAGLLVLAKADYDQGCIRLSAHRLDELLLDAREAVLRANPDYRVELVFSAEPDDEQALTVEANAYLLTTAFVNLMDNNCKYSPDRTSVVKISGRTVSFSDNGCGIPEADLERIFEVFYRGSNSSGSKGHGIGLALVRKVLDLHGASVGVRSHEGAGTVFVVKF